MAPTIDILGISLKSFGLIFAFAFVCSGALAWKRLRELGKPTEWAYEAVFAALIGGLIGARVYYLIEHADDLKGDLLGNLFGGAGLVFYGGLLGGIIAVSIWALWRRFFGLALVDLAAPSLAIGYAVGRIGCQISGDGDYGVASDLPWAMAYPDGVVPIDTPVHPTPIYEAVAMGLFTWLLWRLRDTFRPGILFGIYLVGAGLERLLIEFIRRNEAAVLGLTDAQLTAIAMMVVGVVWLVVVARRQGGYLRAATAA